MSGGVWVSRMDLGDSGLAVGIKDSIDIAGYQTRLGSEAYAREPVPRTTAVVVERLLEKGFRVTGKTNLHELAFGMTGVNGYFGTPVNPNFPDYIPGGSSSGSAVAVARGDVDVALGTDTGGSIRLPAACCGVFGLKPTFGRVSRDGVWPADTSLDCVGGFARNMPDLIRLQAAIDPAFQPMGDVNLADVAVALHVRDASPAIAAAVAEALAQSGVHVDAVELPYIDDAFHAGMTVIGYETFGAYSHLMGQGLLGADVELRLEKAKPLTPQDIDAAERVRATFSAQIDALLEQYSVIATPALPDFPLKRDAALAGAQDLAVSRYIRPFNLSGHPAIVVPLQTDLEGPCAIQLIARKNHDAWLCGVAAALAEKS